MSRDGVFPARTFSLAHGDQLEHFRIRPCIEADLAAVALIESRAHSHPWSRAQFENCLSIGNLALVIEREAGEGGDSAVLAYGLVSIGGGEAEIINIAVAPDQQGRGLGSCILQALLEDIGGRAEGVFLEVRESNARAIALYERFHFNQVGLRPNYYPASHSQSSAGAKQKQGGREDAYIYARDLGAAPASLPPLDDLAS